MEEMYRNNEIRNFYQEVKKGSQGYEAKFWNYGKITLMDYYTRDLARKIEKIGRGRNEKEEDSLGFAERMEIIKVLNNRNCGERFICRQNKYGYKKKKLLTNHRRRPDEKRTKSNCRT